MVIPWLDLVCIGCTLTTGSGSWDWVVGKNSEGGTESGTVEEGRATELGSGSREEIGVEWGDVEAETVPRREWALVEWRCSKFDSCKVSMEDEEAGETEGEVRNVLGEAKGNKLSLSKTCLEV